jgi:hypothetical protein
VLDFAVPAAARPGGAGVGAALGEAARDGVSQNGYLLSRRGRSLPASVSGFDTHRASISSRFDCRLDAARGMCFLHGKGIVHRDLKSANLLVCAVVIEARWLRCTGGCQQCGTPRRLNTPPYRIGNRARSGRTPSDTRCASATTGAG